MIISERRVMEGEQIPTGYRIAYRERIWGDTICYPIGVHLLARWVRRIWEQSFRYRPSKFEAILAEVAREAYKKGVAQMVSRVAAAEHKTSGKMEVCQALEVLGEWADGLILDCDAAPPIDANPTDTQIAT